MGTSVGHPSGFGQPGTDVIITGIRHLVDLPYGTGRAGAMMAPPCLPDTPDTPTQAPVSGC
ncbi:hypothetical protein GCM10010394_57280 [Streptomyces crystallinus]|uniref:Uncharacterized protein n=1 Tax=Streptomyces crystallinus TaxID=68191 RepID=A0ABP3RWR8_9ACTN